MHDMDSTLHGIVRAHNANCGAHFELTEAEQVAAHGPRAADPLRVVAVREPGTTYAVRWYRTLRRTVWQIWQDGTGYSVGRYGRLVLDVVQHVCREVSKCVGRYGRLDRTESAEREREQRHDERERERQGQRQRQTETETGTDRDRDRQRQGQRKRDIETESQRDREAELTNLLARPNAVEPTLPAPPPKKLRQNFK
eukprot:3915557-Rhodomonas_salina.1